MPIFVSSIHGLTDLVCAMSKAFVSESLSDDLEDDESLSPALTIPTGSKNYMTPAGHARMRTEFEHLVKRERPHMVEVVAWAASNGDRSENGDYIYGKKRLREIDRRIRYLTKRMGNVLVVDPLQQNHIEQVFFGATVQILDEDGILQTYQIVGLDEVDLARGRLSWLSPLARALLKARVGELVRFMSPLGWRELEITEIRYESIN